MRNISHTLPIFPTEILLNLHSGSLVSFRRVQQLKPGTYEVDWDGSNYSSGVYFYKLETDNFSQTKKLVLLK